MQSHSVCKVDVTRVVPSSYHQSKKMELEFQNVKPQENKTEFETQSKKMELEIQNVEPQEKKTEFETESGGSDGVAAVIVTNVTRGSWSCMDKYSYVLSRFYWLVMLIIFKLVIICGVLAMVLGSFPSFEDPIKGFEPRGTDIKDRTLSYVNLKRDPLLRRYWTKVNEQACEGSVLFDYQPTNNTRVTRSVNDGSITFGKCNPAWYHDCAGIVFTHANGEDLLTPSNLKTICSIKVTGSNTSEVYKPWSIGDYLGQLVNRSCSSLDEGSITAALSQLKECAPHYYRTTKDDSGSDVSCLDPYYYTGCVGIPESCLTENIIFIILNIMADTDFMPAGKLDNKILRRSMALIDLSIYDEVKLEGIYEDYFQKSSRAFNDVVAVALNFNIKYSVFSKYLLYDTLYVGIAAIVVIILIWVYTASVLISIAALFNMIFSLVVAYFIYTFVFNLNFFPFLNVSTALLLVAIGADDTFIFCDLWREAKSTSDDGSPRYLVLSKTMQHATITMFVTSFTTASAFYASAFSPIIAIKCFGVYAGTAIMINFILTISWLPAAVMLNDTLGCNMCSFSKLCPNFLESLTQIQITLASSLLPNVIIKLRFIWIIFFTFLAVFGCVIIFFLPGLQKPTSSEFQVFKSADLLEQYDLIYKDKFRFEQKSFFIPAGILFGLRAVDNGKKWDPDDTGSIRYQSGFDISAEASQIWLQQFCRHLQNQTFKREDAVISGCFIDDFITFMEAPCQCNLTLCCNQTTFPLPSEIFMNCLPSFLNDLGYYDYEYYGLYIDEEDEVKVLEISFLTSSPFSMEYSVMDSFWKETEGWMAENVVKVPKTLGMPWFIPPFTVGDTSYYDYLGFYDLQDSLARSTPISIIISIAVASLVLLLTQRNILIAFYSILSLSGTIFVTIAFLVLLGWELNILESVTFSITVGLSVDFTIHYGVAYILCEESDRRSRMRYSVKTMALAIVFAAFSTFSVGAFMMAATVLAYRQLGTFLMIVMTTSWLFSTFFFQSLCYWLGPQGSTFKLQCKK